MTVNPRTICVDVDNTLGDYTGALRRFVYDHFDKAYPCPDSREYDFSRCPRWPFTGKPDTFRKIHSKAVDNGLYELEEAYPHAAEALQRLHDAGWRIVIATARKDDGGALPVWLADNRIPYDGIYYGPDKLDVRASVLVDDHPDIIRVGVAAGLRVFKPAHEYCQWGGGTVFRDWVDVPRLLGVLWWLIVPTWRSSGCSTSNRSYDPSSTSPTGRPGMAAPCSCSTGWTTRVIRARCTGVRGPRSSGRRMSTGSQAPCGGDASIRPRRGWRTHGSHTRTVRRR